MPSAQDRYEILKACSRKIHLSENIDLHDYVDGTEGYSGADLQAVMYNAHLECIHSNISAAKSAADAARETEANGAVETELEYISYKGDRQANGHAVESRAEKAKMTKRVRLFRELPLQYQR